MAVRTANLRRTKMERREYFKDKGLLFFCATGEIISFYLALTFMKETYFFIIPTTLFGILGLLEIGYLKSKHKTSSD